MLFQDIISSLNNFWSEKGCLLLQPYDLEKGAGTMSPHSFLRAIGPEPWAVAYPEPCRRPTDGRYGDNPNRAQHYFQYQVLIKPSLDGIQEIYLSSLEALGISAKEHDIRFVEDNWESPTLGAWGVGWEVWLDGMEVTQFTYFQQCGGLDCKPVSIEITYGLERLAMYLQNVESIWDLSWNKKTKYGDIWLPFEKGQCKYNFEESNSENLRKLFEIYEEKQFLSYCSTQNNNLLNQLQGQTLRTIKIHALPKLTKSLVYLHQTTPSLLLIFVPQGLFD